MTNEPPHGDDPQRPSNPGDLPAYGSYNFGQVPPPPGGYGGGDDGGYGPPEQNKKALWSLVLGVVGLCCGIAGVVAIFLANKARQEIAESGGRQTGSGLATAGLVLGILSVVLWIVSLVIRFGLLSS
jgi:hypothetical protein